MSGAKRQGPVCGYPSDYGEENMPRLSESECAEKRDWLSKPHGSIAREESLALLDTIDALRGELAEAKGLLERADQAVIDFQKRCDDVQAQLAPNPACGHAMAYWVQRIDSIEGDRDYCSLCREKEAAVAAALEKAKLQSFENGLHAEARAQETYWKAHEAALVQRILERLAPSCEYPYGGQAQDGPDACGGPQDKDAPR